jgi:GNAT superfamily N-acetyltransferase
MWWRLPAKEFDAGKGEPNRQAFHRLVRDGATPGLIGYRDQQPVGWVAVEPRSRYPRMERSRVLARVDRIDVWAVGCLFVAREHRRTGVSVALLEAATAHAAGRGAVVLEGYPVDPAGTTAPPAFVWTGTASAFRAAGFEEVARRSAARPVMRRRLG